MNIESKIQLTQLQYKAYHNKNLNYNNNSSYNSDYHNKLKIVYIDTRKPYNKWKYDVTKGW